MLECVKKTKEGFNIYIHAVPCSKNTFFSYDSFSKELRVKICAPAVDGKANRELLSILKGFFGDVELKSGLNSRKKVFLVKGKSQEDVEAILNKIIV